MTQQYNFQALLDEAQKEGIGGGLLPNGNYNLLAKIAKVSASSGGKDQIGVMWYVVDGAMQGQTTWENQTLSPENPKAMAAFFGWAKRFGMDNAFFQRQPQPSLAEIANNIQGITINADVASRKWGKNMDKEDNTFSKVTVLSGPGAAPASVPATAPVAPVAAPVAPVAVVPAPEPAAAPVAAVDPTQDPAYQAFLAAQAQAAAPAAALPVVPTAVVPQPVAPVDPATGLPVRSF